MPNPCIVHHPYNGQTIPAIHAWAGKNFLHFVASGELGKAEAVQGILRSLDGKETRGVTKSKPTDRYWIVMFRIDDPDPAAAYDVVIQDGDGVPLAVCKNIQFTIGKASPTLARPNLTDGGAMPLVDREYEHERLKLYLEQGTHCQIVGPVGAGKTVLLSNLGRIAAELGTEYRVAYVDLLDPSCQTVGGFLARASAEWGITPPCAHLIYLDERVRDWRRSGIRPVLCLDDFPEMLWRDQEFTTEFFVDLRTVAQAGLTLVTASQQPLSELIPWYSRTASFFTNFQILRLRPLPRKGAAE